MSGAFPAAADTGVPAPIDLPMPRVPGGDEGTVVQAGEMDWAALARDPDFNAFAARKRTAVSALLGVSLVLFFAYPVVCGFFPGLLTPKVFGVVNVGLLFTIAEPLSAFALALLYIKLANTGFDEASSRLIRRHTQGGIR